MTLDEWRAAGLCKGLIVDGVIDNGDGTYRPNDIAVNPESYWKSASENCPSMFIYDNSYVKCREITFGYTFPEKMLGKTVKGLSVSFVARNTVSMSISNSKAPTLALPEGREQIDSNHLNKKS